MEQAAVFSMTFDPRVSEDIVPSLILLFSLFLRGSLDAGAGVAAPSIHVLTPTVDRRSARSAGVLPLACLSVGIATSGGNTSFGSLKQIDAGILNVGYADVAARRGGQSFPVR